jgi:hypothetical protein
MVRLVELARLVAQNLEVLGVNLSKQEEEEGENKEVGGGGKGRGGSGVPCLLVMVRLVELARFIAQDLEVFSTDLLGQKEEEGKKAGRKKGREVGCAVCWSWCAL